MTFRALVGIGAALTMFAVGLDRGAKGIGTSAGSDICRDFVAAIADDRGDAVVAVNE